MHAGLQASDLAPRQRRRLLMVRDAANGDDVEKIAAYGRVDVQTVHRWLKAYQAGAMAALANRPRAGHPPTPGEADWAALEATPVGGSPAAGAAGERAWTVRQPVDWLAGDRAVRLSRRDPGARTARHRSHFIRRRTYARVLNRPTLPGP